MFCEKCGNQLQENSNQCSNCENSSQLTYVDDPNDTIELDNSYLSSSDQKKPNYKKLIVFSGILAILIIGAFSVIASNTHMFKSPKQIYLDVEGRNIMSIINNSKDSSKTFYQSNVKSLLDNSHQTRNEFSANLDFGAQNFTGQDLSSVSNLLDNSKLVIDTKYNPAKNHTLINSDIIINNNKVFDILLALDNEMLAVSVPVLFSEYVTADVKELNGITSNLGLPVNPNTPNIKKVLTPNDIIAAININEKKATSMLKKYGKVFGDTISDEKITMEKNVDFKVNDLDFTCNKLTIDLDKESFENIIMNLVEAIENDDEFYNLVLENAKNILALFEESGYINDSSTISDIEETLSMDNYKKSMSQFKENLAEQFEQIDFPEGIKMSIYVNGNTIIGRSIDTKISAVNSDNVFTFNIKTSGVDQYKNKNIKNAEIKFGSTETEYFDEILINYSYDTLVDNGNKTEKGKSKLTVDVSGNLFSATLFNMDIGIEKGKGNYLESIKNSYNYDIVVSIPVPFPTTIKINGNLDVDSWEQKKDNKFGRDVDFNTELNLSGFMGNQKIGSGGFKFKNETTLNVDFDMPVIDSTNSIDVSTASQEELSLFYMKIQEELENLIKENGHLMNIF